MEVGRCERVVAGTVNELDNNGWGGVRKVEITKGWGGAEERVDYY